MLIRRVLRASAIGMRDPDGRQAERLGEDVVRQGAAGIRNDGRGLDRPVRSSEAATNFTQGWSGSSREALKKVSREGSTTTLPKPCRFRWRRSAGMMSSGSMPTTKRSWQRAQARGGMAFTGASGVPQVKASTENEHQPKTRSAGVSPASPQFAIDARRAGIAAGLDAGEHAPNIRRKLRRHPFGNTDLPGRPGDRGDGVRKLDSRIGKQPSPIARMVPALTRLDHKIEIERAARAERKVRTFAVEAWPVGADQHVGRKEIAMLAREPREARRTCLLAHLDEIARVEAELAARAARRPRAPRD